MLLSPSATVYNLDEADVEGQRQRFELYDKVPQPCRCTVAQLGL